MSDAKPLTPEEEKDWRDTHRFMPYPVVERMYATLDAARRERDEVLDRHGRLRDLCKDVLAEAGEVVDHLEPLNRALKNIEVMSTSAPPGQQKSPTQVRAEAAEARCAELEYKRMETAAELYNVMMTCPVCKEYGDGCNCGGVDSLREQVERLREQVRALGSLSALLDAALRPLHAYANESAEADLDERGHLTTDHGRLMRRLADAAWLALDSYALAASEPEAATDIGYGCTGCRSTPCICDKLREPEGKPTDEQAEYAAGLHMHDEPEGTDGESLPRRFNSEGR